VSAGAHMRAEVNGKRHHDPLIGRQLANFRIEHVIGRGGMAQVYYGWDVKLERPVALKVIDARYRDDPAYARRFVQEARAVAAWRHENIIQIYYADDQEGLYYYVMEYIDGRDLAQLLATYSADGELMPQADVVRIGRAMAAALDYAHRRGVVHRDVKPSNVMVARDGRVVLGDFGLALDVQHGSIGEAFGSPHYMAPEQARRSTDAVPQSDLYALAVILYEMLTGVVPFDDPSPTTVALQHMTLPPTPPRAVNPNLSAEVEGVVLKALHKQPELRYQTGRELMDALEAGLRRVPPAEDERPSEPRPVSLRSVDDQVARAGAAPAAPERPEQAPRDTQPRPPTGLRRASRVALRPLLAGGLLFLGLLAAAAWALSAARGPGGARGQPYVAFYNENSFYLLNLSRVEAPIEAVAFERLSDDGQSISRFEGARWAEFYPTIRPGACVRIEVLDSPPHLQPAECTGGYLSTRTPVPGDPMIFWTPQPGSGQFRMLWQGEEAGRCESAAGICRVFVP
jgi:serine/threonine protein kinase